jgi:hypothetical protein
MLFDPFIIFLKICDYTLELVFWLFEDCDYVYDYILK